MHGWQDKNLAITIGLCIIGVYYFDSGDIFIYLFDSMSGKLMRVGSYIHNVTLNMQYSENRLRSVEHSESGKRLRVNYTIFDRIQSIELFSADHTVEKAK